MASSNNEKWLRDLAERYGVMSAYKTVAELTPLREITYLSKARTDEFRHELERYARSRYRDLWQKDRAKAKARAMDDVLNTHNQLTIF